MLLCTLNISMARTCKSIVCLCVWWQIHQGGGDAPPPPPPYFCVGKRKNGNKRKKERVSFQLIMVVDNTFQCSMPPRFLPLSLWNPFRRLCINVIIHQATMAHPYKWTLDWALIKRSLIFFFFWNIHRRRNSSQNMYLLTGFFNNHFKIILKIELIIN